MPCCERRYRVPPASWAVPRCLRSLRVGSGSLSLGSVGLPGKASEHEADHRKMDVGDGETCPVFIVLGEAAAGTEPCECTFDDPSLGQNLETDRMIGALDDF